MVHELVGGSLLPRPPPLGIGPCARPSKQHWELVPSISALPSHERGHTVVVLWWLVFTHDWAWWGLGHVWPGLGFGGPLAGAGPGLGCCHTMAIRWCIPALLLPSSPCCSGQAEEAQQLIQRNFALQKTVDELCEKLKNVDSVCMEADQKLIEVHDRLQTEADCYKEGTGFAMGT